MEIKLHIFFTRMKYSCLLKEKYTANLMAYKPLVLQCI
jgi:hypothetical protein